MAFSGCFQRQAQEFWQTRFQVGGLVYKEYYRHCGTPCIYSPTAAPLSGKCPEKQSISGF
jgi:hypothetical protein